MELQLLEFPSVISQNSPIIIGVSGGPDSIAVCHSLLQKGYKNLHVAYVNHLWRKNSHKDEEYVAMFCKEYNLFLYNTNLIQLEAEFPFLKKIKNKEDKGREARYSYFNKLKKEKTADVVVTGHHLDDQTETIIMNFIRGSGLTGICGMKALTRNIWRPALNCLKKELVDYCHYHSLKYITDPSNTDTELKRNAFRHEIIPFLEHYNPNLKQTLYEQSKLWRMSDDALQTLGRKLLTESMVKKNSPSPGEYHTQHWLGTETIVRYYALRQLYFNCYGHCKNISLHHLQQIDALICSPLGNKQKEFGPLYWLQKKQHIIRFLPYENPRSH